MPTSPEIDAMFTMTGLSRRNSCGSAARACTNIPRTFTVIRVSHSSSVVSRMSLPRNRPALLTRMSRPPKFSTAAATAASAVAACDTSPTTAVIRPSSVASSETEGWMSSTTMLAPRSCKRRTISLPIPPAAPVTIATFPSKSCVTRHGPPR